MILNFSIIAINLIVGFTAYNDYSSNITQPVTLTINSVNYDTETNYYNLNYNFHHRPEILLNGDYTFREITQTNRNITSLNKFYLNDNNFYSTQFTFNIYNLSGSIQYDSTNQLILYECSLTIQITNNIQQYNYFLIEVYEEIETSGLYEDNKININATPEQSFSINQEEAYTEGKGEGYEEGISGGNGILTLLEGVFNTVDNFFQVEILPGIKLWYIIGVPLVLSLIFFFINLWR